MVVVEAGALPEACVTQGARVRLLARVPACVHRQHVFVVEACVAERACMSPCLSAVLLVSVADERAVTGEL